MASDGNNDSKLDKKEFAAFQNPEHHRHMHDTLIQVTLNEKDKDKDGKISFQEYIGEAGKKRKSQSNGAIRK